jgi:hypothetical protein
MNSAKARPTRSSSSNVEALEHPVQAERSRVRRTEFARADDGITLHPQAASSSGDLGYRLAREALVVELALTGD